MFARTLGFLNYFTIAFTIVAAAYFSEFAYAADPLPGSACSVNNSRIRSGGPETSGIVYDMTCQGGVWVATLTFAANSFVGIGTTNPGNSLHARVQDSATNTVTNLLRIEHETTGTPAANFGTGLLFTGESDTTLNRDMAQISSLWTTATDASRASAITFSTLTGGGSLTERVRIDGAGYVGIGTTTPSAPLEILSSAVGIEALNLHRSTSNNNVGTGVLLQRSRADSTAPGAGFGSDIQFDLEGFTNNTFASAANIAVGWEVAQTNDTTARDSYLAYSTMLDNASAERMRITSAGRVGIGTTSPSTDVMLDVNGNMKATGRIYSGATTDTDALSNISLSFTSANLIRATGASAACGTLNFTNVLAGQSVSVTIPNATTTCSTIQLSGSTANVKLPSGYTGGAAVTGVVYTALYDGTTLWVSWVPF